MVFTAGQMQEIFSDNALQWDTLVNIATFGLNTVWKFDLANNIRLEKPDIILELGSGTGSLTLMLARLFPNSKIIALDISTKYLNIARKRAAMNKIDNITFIHGDAQLPSKSFPSNFKTDMIISSYLAKYLDNKIFIKDTNKILRRNGLLIIHEIVYPTDVFAQLLYNNHVRVVTVLMSINPLWKNLAMELNAIFINNQWKNQLLQSLYSSGYHVKIQNLPLNVSSIIYAKKSG